MPSIDERVVAMAFENQVFETRVAQTIATLGKLDTAVKSIGNAKGLEDIEKAANKVTLNAPMSALDKLKAKLSRSGDGAAQGFSDIERASSKVTLDGAGKAIDKTQAKLSQLSSGSTFTDIERDSDRVTLSGLTRAIDGVSNHFSVLAGAAAVALGGIASQAAMKGAAFAKSFAFGPILDGLNEYQTNLQSIQTIQANTDQPLTKINASLQELNHYSDQTIYNFSQMARNIGTFTAAGVDLKTATSSIKGIANLAALSGSNSQQAATAMYQLSQAIASGRVGLQDWNSVVNAGMGGKKLQHALATTSIAMGQMKDSSVKLVGPMKKLTIHGESFRESIQAKPGQKPWLTSEVLVNTLATLDGRFSKAALSAELTKDGLKKYTAAQIEAKIAANRLALEQKNGVKYTDAQFEALQKLSDSAFKSATEVKTLGQVFDVAKETIGSGWSASFQSIFGTLKEAKTTFTGMSNAINGFINANALARNTVLHDWKELGGRSELIAGLKQAFQDLAGVLKPIGQAFRDIFPRKTGQELFEFTKNFHQLMVSLKPSPQLVDNIRRIFAGLFAVMHIGWTVIKGVVSVIADLLGVVGHGSGGILNFAGSMGDFLVAMDKALTKGNLLKSFFKTLSGILQTPVTMIINLAKAFFGMFGSADNADKFGKTVGDSLGNMSTKLEPVKAFVDRASDAWERFLGVMKQVGQFLNPFFQQFKDIASNVSNVIADSFNQANFDNVLKALQTGLLGGLFLQFRKLLAQGIGVDVGGGLLTNLSKTFGALTGHLQAMQKNVQASTLLKIASAIGILAAAVAVLALIDPTKLGNAMTAVAVGLGQLVGAMALLTKVGGARGFIAVPAMAAGMVLMAGALLILAGAMKIFATMSWDQLIKGLTGVGGGLVAIGLGMKLLGPGTLIQGPALIAIGLGLNVIAAAVKQFASLSWKDLGKGLAGVAGSLLVLAGAMLLMPPNMVVSGLGLIAMATGMTLLAGAVAAMGSLKIDTIAKGILGVALAVAAISVAMIAMPPTLPLTAAGMVILGVALTELAGAIGAMGSLKVGTLAKGIIAMAAVLVELAIGLTLMAGTLPGSVALLAAAAAFAILGPAIAVLGNLDIKTIAVALGVMAATMGVLAVVGALAAIPLAQLGAALIVLGLGLIAVTAPIYLFAKAMALLSESGQKGVAAMVVALTGFVAILPKIVIDFIKGLVDILNSLADIAPKVVTSLGRILDTVIQFVISKAPSLAVAVGTLIGSFLTVVDANAPKIIDSGLKLITSLLTGIQNNIGRIVTTAANVIAKFLGSLQGQAPRLTQAGVVTLVAFLNGISAQFPKLVGTVVTMVARFVSAVASQIPKVLGAATNLILKFIGGVASMLPRVVLEGVKIIGNFLAGVAQALPKIVTKAVEVAGKFISGVSRGLVRLVNIGADAVINFLNGVANTIRTKGPELRQAGYNIADAILDGIVAGFKELGAKAIDAVKGLINKLPGAAKKVLGIKSPSRVFAEIGKFTMLGFKAGIEESQKPVNDAASTIGNGLIGAFKDVFQIRSPSRVLKEIGKEVGQGFRDGLDGSGDDIRNSFSSLREKLNEEMRTQRENIKQEKDKLVDLQKQYADKLREIADLKKHPVKNAEEIATAQNELKDLRGQINDSIDAIQGYENILSHTRGAHSLLVNSLQDEKKQLISLSKDLDTVTTKLETAQKELERIQGLYADQAKSVHDTFSRLPDINKDVEDQVADYKKQLSDQVTATKKFYETMKALRAAGLDDVTFKKLLSEGLGASDFADQLLAGGAAGIKQINDLDAELEGLATGMGTNAADSLYGAGVAAAQGVVDGLKAEKKNIEDAMKVIADGIVNAIKSSLGIQSPSRVLAEVGQFAMAGFAKGLDKGSAAVKSAAQTAVDAAKETFASITADSFGDVDPVITPVLDLSQVEKGAQKLGDLTNVTPITAAASFGQAASISAERTAAQAEAAQAGKNVTEVKFEQNNYSPESLSDIEIYRQTNNQLSQLKSLVGRQT